MSRRPSHVCSTLQTHRPAPRPDPTRGERCVPAAPARPPAGRLPSGNLSVSAGLCVSRSPSRQGGGLPPVGKAADASTSYHAGGNSSSLRL